MVNYKISVTGKGKMKIMNEQKKYDDSHSLLIIMPSYNEADNLTAAVLDLRENLSDVDILVVDDGSTDRTKEVALDLGCRLLKLPFNIGIGGAVQTGYKYAYEKGYAFAVQFDGDGQHSAKSLPKMISVAKSGSWDLVIGSRYLEDNEYFTPLARRMGMVIFSRIVSMVVHQKITDSTSGFRVLSRRAIEFCANNYPADYPEVEVIPQLYFAGLTITEVPAGMKKRQRGKSSITWSKAIYYMVKVVLAISISLLREKPDKGREVA